MFSDLGLCFPCWHSDQIPSHGKMVRDSRREKRAYSSLLRDGIKSRCLLQRLSRVSWNQEMTVAPGVARLPQDTRERSEASIRCVCQAFRAGWGLPSNRNPGFIELVKLETPAGTQRSRLLASGPVSLTDAPRRKRHLKTLYLFLL